MSKFSAILRLVQRLILFARPPYHPERYYMRGPGPACARRQLMDGGPI